VAKSGPFNKNNSYGFENPKVKLFIKKNPKVKLLYRILLTSVPEYIWNLEYLYQNSR
jgi:hypothetical protein